MRKDEKHLDWTPDQLLEILLIKLVPGRLYYHCIAKGIIFEDKVNGDYENPIVDIYGLTGKYHIALPKAVPELLITSGLTKEGLEYMLNKKGD